MGRHLIQLLNDYEISDLPDKGECSEVKLNLSHDLTTWVIPDPEFYIIYVMLQLKTLSPLILLVIRLNLRPRRCVCAGIGFNPD